MSAALGVSLVMKHILPELMPTVYQAHLYAVYRVVSLVTSLDKVSEFLLVNSLDSVYT